MPIVTSLINESPASKYSELPVNHHPVLVCQSGAKCGWARHHFVRINRTKEQQNMLRQIFACEKCGHERLFGVVDVA